MGKKQKIIQEESNYYSTGKKFQYYYDKDIYQRKFEDVFLLETQKMYDQEACEIILEKNVIDYLEIAERRINEEKDRLKAYLDPSTYDDLIKIITRCFIT